MKKIVLALLILSLAGCYETEKGEKIGTVVKLAKEGVICKSWEAQLIRGGLSNGNGGFGSRAFDFVVEKPELLEKVKSVMNSQNEVKIYYHKEAFTFCRSESHKVSGSPDDVTSNYFLDDIQIIK